MIKPYAIVTMTISKERLKAEVDNQAGVFEFSFKLINPEPLPQLMNKWSKTPSKRKIAEHRQTVKRGELIPTILRALPPEGEFSTASVGRHLQKVLGSSTINYAVSILGQMAKKGLLKRVDVGTYVMTQAGKDKR